jgi:transcriptional antiterminator RfaH
MENWYAVHTQANGEAKARFNLANQGFHVYMPQHLKRRRHARQTSWIRKPLFPRYLFVRMALNNVRWRSIHSTIGVSHLLCQGERPVPVPGDFIDEVKSCENEHGVVMLDRFLPVGKGDVVEFVSGPLASLTGVFDGEHKKDRSVVLLEILGRRLKIVTRSDALAT